MVKKAPLDAPQDTTSLDFQSALAQLEALVVALEQGEQPLEQAMEQFERGVALTRHCHDALSKAEQKVQRLQGDTLSEL